MTALGPLMIGLLSRSKPLLPSKLAVASKCSLRYVLETESPATALLPEAIPSCVGRAVHASIEMVVRGSLTRDADAFANAVRKRLENILASHATAVSVAAALRRTLTTELVISTADLLERLRVGFRFIESITAHASSPGNSRPIISAGVGNSNQSRTLTRRGSAELGLESTALDVRGRADLVERLGPDTLRVTDIKSGRAFAEQEQPDSSFVLQISTYGLLLADRYPGTKIILRILARDGEWQEELTPKRAHDARRELRSLRDKLPRLAQLKPAALASPGRVCDTCQHRPGCGSYRDWAREPGRTARDNIPLDIWGELTSVERRAVGLADLNVRDHVGRFVRIVNVPESMISDSRVGASIAAFQLASSEGGRSRAFPHNFYVVDSHRPCRSAYSAFIELGTAP